jgi:hypothetical protein
VQIVKRYLTMSRCATFFLTGVAIPDMIPASGKDADMPHETAYLAPIAVEPDRLPQVDRRAGIRAAETYLAIREVRRASRQLRRLALSLVATLAAIAWILVQLWEASHA